MQTGRQTETSRLVVDAVGSADSWWSGRMPASETCAAVSGGDDALNADLIGSLRDTVRQTNFLRDAMSMVPAFLGETFRTTSSTRDATGTDTS